MVSMMGQSLLPRSLVLLQPALASSSKGGGGRGRRPSSTSSRSSSPSSSSFYPSTTSKFSVKVHDTLATRLYCILEFWDKPLQSSLLLSKSPLNSASYLRTPPPTRIPFPIRRLSSHPFPSHRPPWSSSLSFTHHERLRPRLARAFHSSPTLLATEETPGSKILDLAVREGEELKFRASRSGAVALDKNEIARHKLSNEQEAILQKALDGGSFFFTGAAGTGKSFLLRKIISDLKNSGKEVAVCSSTGISAVNIGGNTIHSWAGIGLGRGRFQSLINRINDKASRRRNWTKTDVLIIDEVSMISSRMFDMLEEIGRTLRQNKQPFGGMQVIVTGDFLQLPPVYIEKPETPDEEQDIEESYFAFEARSWARTLGTPLFLKEIFRQTDPLLIQHLNTVRLGRSDVATAQFFRSLQQNKWPDRVSPTKLFATVAQVLAENYRRLEKLNEVTFRYDAFDAMIPSLPREVGDQLSQTLGQISIPQVIELKIGAQVMCKSNIFAGRIVNGTVGVVAGFMTLQQAKDHGVEIAHNGFHPAEPHWDSLSVHHHRSFPRLTPGEMRLQDKNPATTYQIAKGDVDPPEAMFPVVKVYNAELNAEDAFLFKPVTFVVSIQTEESSETLVAVRRQIPLVLGYAVTIHKSQGQSIDRVSVDCSRIFADGQAYVALSRARSLGGLQVTGYMSKYVRANPRVLAWMDLHGQLPPDPRFLLPPHHNGVADVESNQLDWMRAYSDPPPAAVAGDDRRKPMRLSKKDLERFGDAPVGVGEGEEWRDDDGIDDGGHDWEGEGEGSGHEQYEEGPEGEW